MAKRWARTRLALQWVGERARSGLAAIGLRGGAVVLLAVLVLWGVRASRHVAGEMPQFRVCPTRFRASAPEWCADDLGRIQFPKRSYSIFDPDLTRDVAEAYAASPWVAEVQKVEKRFPNALHVSLRLREPVAFVRLPAGCYEVDGRGVKLPLDYTRWPHLERPLPLIFGVGSAPPEAGQKWRDRRVQAALSVLGALAADQSTFEQIHVVDVANLDGEIDPLQSEVLLHTRSRVRVLWGRPPNTKKCGEPAVREKLARLRRCLADPRVAAGNGTAINLRFPDDNAMARQWPPQER